MTGQSANVETDRLVNTGQSGLLVTRANSGPMTLAQAFAYANEHNRHVPTIAEAEQIIATVQGIDGECDLTIAFKGVTSILCANDGDQKPVTVFFNGDEPVVQTEDTIGRYRFVQSPEERGDHPKHHRLML